MAFKVSSFLVTCVVSCPPEQMSLRVPLNVEFDSQQGGAAQCQTNTQSAHGKTPSQQELLARMNP